MQIVKTNPNRLTPFALAGGGAVTAFQIGLGLESLDKLISRINAGCESVSLGQEPRTKVSGSHTGHQERLVPRNSIEEFDPGSA